MNVTQFLAVGHIASGTSSRKCGKGYICVLRVGLTTVLKVGLTALMLIYLQKSFFRNVKNIPIFELDTEYNSGKVPIL